MAVLTLARLSEEIRRLLDGGNIQAASKTSDNEIRLAICQVCNSLLKVEYFTNLKMNERIPNGTVLGWYDEIEITSYGVGKSKATLPAKPVKLPRNMGVWAIYPKYTTNGVYDFDQEFIPLQMGHGALLKSQPMINDLLGQVGYENFGLELVFNKDLKGLFPNIKLGMRLAILDMSQYDDWDVLPLPADYEWDIKKEVLKLYGVDGVADKTVDSSVKEQQNNPIKTQSQA